MSRRPNRLRVTRAKLEGARKHLADIDAGLIERDRDTALATVAELERQMADLEA